MNFQFQSLYARKSYLQTPNQRMFTLLRNISVIAVSIAYHFDPIASWSFSPALLYTDTVISTITMPKIVTTWTIGVNPIEDLLAHGFTIQRGHPLDTIEHRRAAVDQFTDCQWKYF